MEGILEKLKALSLVLYLLWQCSSYQPLFNKGETMKSSPILLKNQKGQSMMEYIILTALVGIFCLASFKKMGKILDKRIQHVNEKIVDNIEID